MCLSFPLFSRGCLSMLCYHLAEKNEALLFCKRPDQIRELVVEGVERRTAPARPASHRKMIVGAMGKFLWLTIERIRHQGRNRTPVCCWDHCRNHEVHSIIIIIIIYFASTTVPVLLLGYADSLQILELHVEWMSQVSLWGRSFAVAQQVGRVALVHHTSHYHHDVLLSTRSTRPQ